MLSPRLGYISSALLPAGAGLGSPACPWRLRVPPGQRINLTISFYLHAAGVATGGGDGAVCYRAVSLREPGTAGGSATERPFVMCPGEQRQVTVYLSAGPTLDVTVDARAGKLGVVLVRYGGRHDDDGRRLLSTEPECRAKWRSYGAKWRKSELMNKKATLRSYDAKLFYNNVHISIREFIIN